MKLTSIVLALAIAGALQQPRQPPGTFRSSIAIVPVDVRVFDSKGHPVTDLTREDFTIYENGVRQPIVQFAKQALVPEDPSPVNDEKPALLNESASGILPSRHRTFLIVLGRGRLQGPSKGLEGLLQFVRKQLLPQDRVAVLAWNRATDFTTDHEKVAQVLERFRDGHHDVEAKLMQRFSGLAGLFGSKDIPPGMQMRIDTIFGGENSPGFRSLPPGRITEAGRVFDDSRRTAESYFNGDLAGPDRDRAEGLDQSLEEYVQSNVQTMSDLQNLYTGIEYLRFLQGEKHLVYVTPSGMFLPRVEDDQSIAGMANDARVVLDTLQVGGISGGAPPTARGPAPMPGPSFTETFALHTLRTMSEMTGGTASIYSYASEALTKIDESTRFGYVLGYQPPGGLLDGTYRHIKVVVNRQGLKVASRQGYYARSQIVPFDRRQFLTYSRVVAAGVYPDLLRDIKLKLRASYDGSSKEVNAEVTINLSRVKMEEKEGRFTGSLDVAIFVANADGRGVGELWKRIDVELPKAEYENAKKDGIKWTFTVPVMASPRKAKVVVYDYAGDVIGSADWVIN